MSAVSLGNGAVELDGLGAGVSVAEIQRVTGLLAQLFGRPPRVRITGRFGTDAIDPTSPRDPNVESWDLRQGTGSGYCEVLSVGPRYVSVQHWSGVNDHRALRLDPVLGTLVRVRFLAPT